MTGEERKEGWYIMESVMFILWEALCGQKETGLVVS